MALKFQYNKTALQQLRKDLRVRENALPVLQAKESALRIEVNKAKEDLKFSAAEYENKNSQIQKIVRLWSEFPDDTVSVKNIILDFKKIAGVKIPVFKEVQFSYKQFSLINSPAWILEGILILKEFTELFIKYEIIKQKIALLEHARKKTTQKVNLYQKVQIPEYNTAILKIKRFLEDEENCAKSSQKILKIRMAIEEGILV